MIETLQIGDETVSYVQAPELTGKETWLEAPWDNFSWHEIGQLHPDAKIIVTLRSLLYREYLRTNHWRGIRTRAWRRYRGQCICGKDAKEAHHFEYSRKGFERQEDVVALCADCHDTWHRTWSLQARESLK